MKEIGKRRLVSEDFVGTPNSKKRRENDENNGEKLKNNLEKKCIEMSTIKRNLQDSGAFASSSNISSDNIGIETMQTDGKLLDVTPNKNSGNVENRDDDKPQLTQKLENPLKDVVAYVEVISGHDNCTFVFREELESLGAKTLEKFNKQVTHVVFKDGRKSTYKRAVANNIHLVSVLWVNACKLSGKHVCEKPYPAIVSEAYTSPFFVGRLRRLQTLHPDDPMDTATRSMAYYDRKRQLKEWRKNRADLFKPDPLPQVLSRILSEKAKASQSYSASIISPPSTGDLTAKASDASDNDSCHSDDTILPLARRLFVNYPDLPTMEYLSDYTNRMGLNSLESRETKMAIIEDAKDKMESELKPTLQEISENISVNGNQSAISRKSLEDFKLPSVTKERKKREITVAPLDAEVKKIVLTSCHSEERKALAKIILELGGYSISNTVDKSTTHVISGDGRRTLNILFALTNGCWILNSDWIYKSNKSNAWLDEGPFESAAYPAAKGYRLEKFQLGSNYKNGLFKNTAAIFVAEKSSPPNKEFRKLLKCASATIVKCHRQACIVLGTAMKNSSAICVKETWALDCITNAKILPTDDYLLHYKSPS